MRNEGLPPPDGAANADPERDAELLRLWFIDGRPEAVMQPAFNNPEWFGVVLSDVCRQMAKVYAAAELMEEPEAFQKITHGLMHGLATPEYTPGDAVAAGGPEQ